ncbi:restriction endonuclease subunit S [Natrarchaeobius oligotrophus]|uniref:Restriction endonuclease subunit S n=1 Tax=Natrarchaeobius chitinivorans TaxID=1679083 RepID=A0A3N6M7Q3_NATCH|nr:restriction endonuclease subunit S [Natrarchaeobius chitinivorans]RQG98297.1 restriction endonuclease subunit S [Natrarchaeobius chitinivorans]
MSEALEQSDLREGYKTVKLGPREIPIPDEWDNVPFDEAIELNPKYEKPDNGPFDYLPMDAVDEEKQTIEYWTQREKDDCTTTWFKNGDTVYAKITPCTENGKIAFIEDLGTEVGSGSTEFLVFHPRDGVTDERFVYYLSNLPEFRSVTISLMEGSTGRQRVPSDVFKGGIQVPLPPLPEQRRIADILSTVDEQIQQTDEIIKETKALRDGLLQDLFDELIPNSGRKETQLGPFQVQIPEHWEISDLDDLNQDDYPICYGVVQPGKHDEDGIPLLNIEDVDETGEIQRESIHKITPDLHEEYSRSQLQGGEVLVSVKGTVGNIVQLNEEIGEANISRDLARVTPTTDLDARWLKYCLSTKIYQDLIDVFSTGSTRASLNIGELREIPIICPPISEQDRISEVLSTVEREIEIERENKQHLQDLKRGLLQDLLTGKVRVSVD